MYIYTHTYIYTYIYTYTHTYMYIYVHVYIYIYTSGSIWWACVPQFQPPTAKLQHGWVRILFICPRRRRGIMSSGIPAQA